MTEVANLKRLTKIIDGEYREDHDDDKYAPKGQRNGNRACMARLGAYEDTSLLPDEIAALQSEINLIAASRDEWKRRADAAEPRVLTLREVQCYQDCPVMWVETIGNSDWRNTNDIINYYAHPDSKKAKDYGVTWRCWTGKPTAEQAINADWQGGPAHETR